ncbi:MULTISPECIES: hypothetical protein [Sphaerimonospora]|uniref:Uncharacterized protein n=2 Tax=Sphaerimonospora TaxID=1792303 RepID=A0A8J3W158_9ACTN|nr:hypothetical protein [Sphaerimonospora thailandensis]GIH72979.1 hypothetical protein Mth01_52320 [Sphaerimonospora thailandensis]
MALLQRVAHEQPDVEVIELTAEEYEAATRRMLEELGVTYDELARQAKERRFDSLRHRKVWLLVREY